jgi:hypothetical protein
MQPKTFSLFFQFFLKKKLKACGPKMAQNPHKRRVFKSSDISLIIVKRISKAVAVDKF